MGRFLAGRTGAIGLIAGSMALRDHAERHFGFHQVLATEFPHLTVLPPLEGRDDSDRNEALTLELLRQRQDLVGLYNIGAGNRGIARAIEATGNAGRITWIAHELTQHTRAFLLRGVLDALINQDAGHEARSAARVLLANRWGEPILADQERIRIEVSCATICPEHPRCLATDDGVDLDAGQSVGPQARAARARGRGIRQGGVVPQEGFEPPTPSLRMRCSTS